MKTQINLSVVGDSIRITSPYSSANIDLFRSLAGKFSGGVWSVPSTAESVAKLQDVFGRPSELVRVSVPVDATKVVARDGQLQIGGYLLANRRGRDYRAEMPEGVAVVSGGFTKSGGSVKNPRVSPEPGTVLSLVCRREFAERMGLVVAAPAAPVPTEV